MDQSNLSNQKLKKIEKKLRKLQHIVLKETGVECSINKPTNILVIANAGLINGLTEETVLEHFSIYGTIETILLIPGKSCCFIRYSDELSAIKASENHNGTLNIAQNSKPIYLLYATSLPNNEDDAINEETVPGLVIFEDFITLEEEQKLLDLCDFESNSDVSHMKNRQVKHFGYEFNYNTNNVDKNQPLTEGIPEECNFWNRLDNTAFKSFIPDQLTVNHYLPGQGIPQHVDTHSAFEDPIMTLSLRNPIVMEFKNSYKHVSVLLKPRSLAVMSGECRYNWTHGITPRKCDMVHTKTGDVSFQRDTRVSYTFRKVLRKPCECMFKTNCDSFKESIEKLRSNAPELEKEHVHKVYEKIAGHFDSTRHKPWPNVVEFLESFETGSIVVDVGCGNGKYLGLNKGVFNVGCDASLNLLDICNKKGLEIFAANCLKIPIKDNCVDGAISIAVIHHLANDERRFSALEEIARILKPGGRALVYVWAKEQEKDQEKSSYLKQYRNNKTPQAAGEASVSNLPIHVNRTQFEYEDLLVPWKLKRSNESNKSNEPNTFLRFYHVFHEDELKELCEDIENIEVIKYYYDQGNWCSIIRKY
ncbi:unnamed protein product [Phyllotreta striolata]|uniref:tRNA (carboxymethyluridine(34)-5-O)-methyltransferase n=1 Tax=Phyllotreta striolata TaxID=444603 RepID=A0A9N9XPM5_PHYSR|nr:unnamed protein product [Phyllotreta striolata]